MSAELKPCPFCDGKAKLYFSNSEGASIMCTECGLTMSRAHSPFKEPFALRRTKETEEFFKKEIEIIVTNAWNTRTGENNERKT